MFMKISYLPGCKAFVFSCRSREMEEELNIGNIGVTEARINRLCLVLV